MPTEAELLQEIFARPWADKPRLAYADLLEKRGDPRGELIRVQVELYHDLAGHKLGPKYSQNYRREIELLKQHGDEWGSEIRPLVDEASFERGFVDYVKCDAGRFLENAERIYALAPLLHLQVTGLAARIDDFFASPALARLRSLLLPGEKVGDAGASRLAASPHLGEVRYLDLFGNQLTPIGVEAIVASPALPKLKFVRWTSNPAPSPNDEPAAIDGDRILEWEAKPIQAELEAKHGRKEFLHYQALWERFYPPKHYDFILPN